MKKIITFTADGNIKIYKIKLSLRLKLKRFFRYLFLYTRYLFLYRHQRKYLKNFYKGNLSIPYNHNKENNEKIK